MAACRVSQSSGPIACLSASSCSRSCVRRKSASACVSHRDHRDHSVKVNGKALCTLLQRLWVVGHDVVVLCPLWVRRRPSSACSSSRRGYSASVCLCGAVSCSFPTANQPKQQALYVDSEESYQYNQYKPWAQQRPCLTLEAAERTAASTLAPAPADALAGRARASNTWGIQCGQS